MGGGGGQPTGLNRAALFAVANRFVGLTDNLSSRVRRFVQFGDRERYAEYWSHRRPCHGKVQCVVPLCLFYQLCKWCCFYPALAQSMKVNDNLKCKHPQKRYFEKGRIQSNKIYVV